MDGLTTEKYRPDLAVTHRHLSQRECGVSGSQVRPLKFLVTVNKLGESARVIAPGKSTEASFLFVFRD